MIDIKLSVNIVGVRNMFSRMAAIDVKGTLKQLRGPATYDQRDHDKREEGPTGRWQGLAASTLARRARMTLTKSGRKRKPNKLLGRLPRAMMSTVAGQSLFVRSRVKWSMAHQAGARVGHGSVLPQRQFFWISTWLHDQVRKAFQAALMAAIAAGKGP